MSEKHRYEIKAKYKETEIIFFKEAFCIGEVWNERTEVEVTDSESGIRCIFPTSCIISVKQAD